METIYSHMLNDIIESDLKIDDYTLEENIKPQYVLLNKETSRTHYYVPIKVKIKSHIEDAKISISEIQHIKKGIIPTVTKHIKKLKLIIKLSEETESFFSEIDINIEEEYELLTTIKVFDGCSSEREIAISSYKKQLHQAEKMLKKFTSNYKAMKKETLVQCRNSISELLKDNGIKSHKVDAQNLMNWNELETPVYL